MPRAGDPAHHPTTVGHLTLAVLCTTCAQLSRVSVHPGSGLAHLGPCAGCGAAFANHTALLDEWSLLQPLFRPGPPPEPPLC